MASAVQLRFTLAAFIALSPSCTNAIGTPDDVGFEIVDVLNEGEPSAGTNRQDEDLEALAALGYVDSAPTDNPEDRGVSLNLPDAFDGMSLYSSRFLASAVLLDMEGNRLHSWEALPNGDHGNVSWMHVELQPNGDLLVVAKDAYIAKLDWDSNILWKAPIRAHHDFDVGERGTVVSLTRRIHRYPIDSVDAPILDDHIALLTPDGRPYRRTALFPLMQFAIHPNRLSEVRQLQLDGAQPQDIVSPEKPGDITHTNSIEVLQDGIHGIAPPGSILLSVREISRIVILDPKMRRVLWEWGKGWLQKQHHATLLENGNILMFDNGVYRRQSRVLEVNPHRKRVAWTFTHPGLFTYFRGAAQRLPNGNTLITESDKGHVIEVTRDKQIVWEFWNPDVNEDHPLGPHRAAIYRMRRYARDYLERELPAAPRATQ